MSDITIGCDPEVFLKKDNTIISAIGLIGGDKRNPKPVEEGAVQEDNVLAEINIVPATDKGTFIYRINKVLTQLRELTQCDLEVKPSHHFTVDYLKSLGGKAVVFGCDREFSAYTDQPIPKPNPYTTLRTAGGHVHIGSEGLDCPQLVKTLDLYLGVPSVLKDPDKERRALYGQAGSYRPKPYGLEYRTLSNFWLSSEELMQWVFDTSLKAVQEYKGVRLPDPDVIRECINNSDEQVAKELCHEYRLV